MAEEKTFSVGVQTSSPKRISVTSNISENPITASADTGLYYSQLSKNWSIGEGLIQNEDYSSKTWAAESKRSADLSKMYSEAASLDYNNLSEAINQYNEQISGVVAEGLETINTSVTDGVSRLEETTEANITEINATLTEIDTVKTNAVNEVKAEGQTQLNNVKSTGFYMRDDKLYFINSEGVEEEFKSGGGGLEIGDIGIAPLGIDETQNKRRYLNGQIVIQEQFTSFTEKVKKAKELYPILFCTETEWQATVTMSTFGQCGKFVIDDEAGTIRLPKITGFIQGLTDLASLGELVEAGLPTHTHTRGTMNITGTLLNTYDGTASGQSGAFWAGGVYTNNGFGFDGNSHGTGGSTGFDASRSWTGSTSAPDNAIYGKSNTVQPESIRYPYFIQLATGSEDSVDVTREIELNNPHSLGDSKYSPVALNNISWLKSEGQWNSKAVYPDYYDWILTNANNGVADFKLSTDTYDDYSWVVNTADETFRLPLLNGEEDLRSAKFKDYTLGETASQYTVPANGWVSINKKSSKSGEFTMISSTTTYSKVSRNSAGVGDELHISLFCNRNEKVKVSYNATGDLIAFNFQYATGNGSLYFYVGETVQNANLINAGRIEETLVNKVDTDANNFTTEGKHTVTNFAFPSNRAETLTVGASGASYIAPADGWVLIGGYAGVAGGYIDIFQNYLQTTYHAAGANLYGRLIFPVRRGTFEVNHANINIEVFRFIYAQGEA